CSGFLLCRTRLRIESRVRRKFLKVRARHKRLREIQRIVNLGVDDQVCRGIAWRGTSHHIEPFRYDGIPAVWHSILAEGSLRQVPLYHLETAGGCGPAASDHSQPRYRHPLQRRWSCGRLLCWRKKLHPTLLCARLRFDL